MSDVSDWICVMIVDGQKSMRSITKKLMKQEGLKHIIEAENGKDALKTMLDLKKEGISPDVIVSRLYMDEMDGMEMITFLRRHKDNTPVIILTGEQDDMVLDVARQSGAFCVLEIPVSAPDLMGAIHKAIGVM